MKFKIPLYLSTLIKKYPNILSGRKNVKKYHNRIIKTQSLIREFYSKKNN